MTALGRAAGVVFAAALLLPLQAGPVQAQQQPDVRLEALRCAAGFGCMTQCEVLTALGLSSSDDARNLYASDHPADYVRDVEKLKGQAPDSCATGEAMATGGSSDSSSDTMAAVGNAQSGSSTKPAEPSGPAPDYTAWEGYSETGCAGTRLDDPTFVMQRSLKVLACFKGEDESFSECGMNPARAVCLMNGYSDVACYGITRAQAAANIDAVCQNGSCPAFSYVVCK